MGQMNRSACTTERIVRSGLLSGLFLCLLPVAAMAENPALPGSESLGGESVAAQPVLFHDDQLGLPFDLAGSETRKLQLQLSEPLSLQAVSESRWLNAGTGSLLGGGVLQWSPSGQLTLGTSLEQEQTRIQFHPLASIHCENGVLEPGSYRASGCYITNDPAVLSRGRLSVGAEYDFGKNALAAIELFREEASMDARGMLPGNVGITPVISPNLTAATQGSVMFPGLAGASQQEYLDSEVSGIDLEFKLGVSTDNAGDLQLGLQFTRVLDGEYGNGGYARNDLLQWTLAEPVDSAAVRFDWQRNSFSGGIQGFYREPVEFLNHDSVDALTTFDVYFTWRTPWNASLSVGASNLLNSGDKAPRESVMKDPFEAVYGRIPYVRYQQDL